MNVTATPLGVVGADGLMVKPVITAAVTDKLAAADVTPFNEAVMLVLPTVTLVATPVVLLMVATAGLADNQVTWLVRLAVVALE